MSCSTGSSAAEEALEGASLALSIVGSFFFDAEIMAVLETVTLALPCVYQTSPSGCLFVYLSICPFGRRSIRLKLGSERVSHIDHCYRFLWTTILSGKNVSMIADGQVFRQYF